MPSFSGIASIFAGHSMVLSKDVVGFLSADVSKVVVAALRGSQGANTIYRLERCSPTTMYARVLFSAGQKVCSTAAVAAWD
jgi:hypothetical protein